MASGGLGGVPTTIIITHNRVNGSPSATNDDDVYTVPANTLAYVAFDASKYIGPGGGNNVNVQISLRRLDPTGVIASTLFFSKLYASSIVEPFATIMNLSPEYFLLRMDGAFITNAASNKVGRFLMFPGETIRIRQVWNFSGTYGATILVTEVASST